MIFENQSNPGMHLYSTLNSPASTWHCDSSDLLCYKLVAEYYLTRKNWPSALTPLDTAIAILPNASNNHRRVGTVPSSTIYSLRAFILLSLERLDESLAEAERVLALLPDDQMALMVLKEVRVLIARRDGKSEDVETEGRT